MILPQLQLSAQMSVTTKLVTTKRCSETLMTTILSMNRFQTFPFWGKTLFLSSKKNWHQKFRTLSVLILCKQIFRVVKNSKISKALPTLKNNPSSNVPWWTARLKTSLILLSAMSLWRVLSLTWSLRQRKSKLSKSKRTRPSSQLRQNNPQKYTRL